MGNSSASWETRLSDRLVRAASCLYCCKNGAAVGTDQQKTKTKKTSPKKDTSTRMNLELYLPPEKRDIL